MHISLGQQLADPQQVHDSGQPFGFRLEGAPARAGEGIVAAAAIFLTLLQQSLVKQAGEQAVECADLEADAPTRLPLHFLHDFVAVARRLEEHEEDVEIGGLERFRKVIHISNWNTGSLLVVIGRSQERKHTPRVMLVLMNYRKLGRTNFAVSEIGYGAWGIGGTQWLGGTDDESLLALRRAIELGVNFIDTALAYGDGHSEKLVGRIVRETKAGIFVATKVPPKNRIWPAQRGVGIQNVFPYDYIVSSAEQSLRNLGLDAIDLLQLHVWNPEWVDREEWRRAFEDLKRSGKVRFAGVSLSDHDPDSGLSVIRTGLIDSVQVIYNIFDQSPEKQLLPLCQADDIGVLARVPLDEGGLSGHLDEHTRFPTGDFREWYFRGGRKKQVAEHVAALRRDLGGGVNLPETALRFCLSHPAVSTVIPGMRTRQHAESNTGVSALGALSRETLTVLKRHAWDRNFYS